MVNLYRHKFPLQILSSLLLRENPKSCLLEIECRFHPTSYFQEKCMEQGHRTLTPARIMSILDLEIPCGIIISTV